MGEIADWMVEGAICQECLGAFEEAVGFPRTCNECDKRSIYELYEEA